METVNLSKDNSTSVTLKVGESLTIKNGIRVTLCKGTGRRGEYFFSHYLDGLNLVYGAVTFDTPADVAAGSKQLLGVAVRIKVELYELL